MIYRKKKGMTFQSSPFYIIELFDKGLNRSPNSDFVDLMEKPSETKPHGLEKNPPNQITRFSGTRTRQIIMVMFSDDDGSGFVV